MLASVNLYQSNLRMYLIPECSAQSLQRCADSDDAKGSERGSSSPSRACPGAMGRRWTGPPVALRVLQARGIPGKPFRREEAMQVQDLGRFASIAIL